MRVWERVSAVCRKRGLVGSEKYEEMEERKVDVDVDA